MSDVKDMFDVILPLPVTVTYPGSDSWTLGAAAHWFPLRDSQDLRLHAAAAYNSGFDMVSLTLGAIYYLRFPRSK